MRGFAGGLAALALFSAAALAQPIPVEAYGRLPALSAASISPDGRKVALAVFEDGRSIIRVIDIGERQVVYRAEVGEDQQLRDVGWADDGRVTYLVSHTFRPGEVLPAGIMFEGAPRRVDYWRYGVVDLATNRAQVLTTNDERPWADQGASLVAPIEGDPGFGRMIGRAPGDESNHTSLFRIDLTNGRVRHIPPFGTNSDTIGFLLDEAGAPVVRYDSDERSNRWRVYVYADGRPRLLLEDVSEWGQPLSVEGMLPDGRLVAHDHDEGEDFSALYILNRTDGSREVLFRRENAEIGGAVLDPWTHRVVGVSWTTETTNQQFFEPDLQTVQDRIVALFTGGSAQIISWSRDRGRFLIYGERGLDGGGYYIIDRGDERVQSLGMLYPELASVDQGERQSITYRARDGVRIPAYLTFPAAMERRDLPLVLLVHGGPSSRDTMDFDWWAAFLASRGYAVLQPNFRGSGGFGRGWQRAGWRQWGGLMQTDVEDGVAALVRAGIVDPARMCIVGASYGGYAALAGATLTPDRYTCAASIAGVSDLEAMLRTEARTTGGEHSMTSDYWRNSIGDREEDRENIRSVSPARLAERVQVPILLIHGTDDTVVPIDQSRRMLRALNESGKDVRFVELRGDDRWLSDAPTRIQMLREVETFLARHLAPAAPPR